MIYIIEVRTFNDLDTFTSLDTLDNTVDEGYKILTSSWGEDFDNIVLDPEHFIPRKDMCFPVLGSNIYPSILNPEQI